MKKVRRANQAVTKTSRMTTHRIANSTVLSKPKQADNSENLKGKIPGDGLGDYNLDLMKLN